MRAAVAFAFACLAAGAPPGEDLNYTVDWPSGLSLGEAHLGARRDAGRPEFAFALYAAVPGFTVSDRYRSLASAGFCSLEFDRNAAHGPRTVREKATFDYRKSVARRVTAHGGRGEQPIPACAHDALDFVCYVRSELAHGRVPPAQQVLLGAPYNVRLEFTGVESIPVNGSRVTADRAAVSTRSAASRFDFEVFVARDSSRTPLLVRASLAAGTFSMELVR